MVLDFSTALPTFVITLREGVEATLVVGIVLAYLRQARQSHLRSWVFAGVAAGIIVSALVGGCFGWMIQALGSSNQKYSSVIEPLLEGGFSLMAIVLLSWMLLWMTQQAKLLKSQVESVVDGALQQNINAGWGIFGLVFFAVLREGFESVLFIAAKFQQGFLPALGALGGLLAAVGIGVLIFKGGVRINLRWFFQIMGLLLLLIVAGLVVTALARFDTAMALLAGMDRQSEALCFYYERFTKTPACILGPLLWNFSRTLPDDRFPGIVLSALFGYSQKLYQVQAWGYGLFLITIGSLYFRSLSGRSLKALPQLKFLTKNSKA